jgi:ribosome-binding protein aMBF1 (putative translation factor)
MVSAKTPNTKTAAKPLTADVRVVWRLLLLVAASKNLGADSVIFEPEDVDDTELLWGFVATELPEVAIQARTLAEKLCSERKTDLAAMERLRTAVPKLYAARDVDLPAAAWPTRLRIAAAQLFQLMELEVRGGPDAASAVVARRLGSSSTLENSGMPAPDIDEDLQRSDAASSSVSNEAVRRLLIGAAKEVEASAAEQDVHAPSAQPREKPRKTPAQKGASGNLQEIVAYNIRMARVEAGLSQRELGRLSGISGNRISVIESSGGNVTLETLDELAKHLNRQPYELLIPKQTLRRP